MVNPQGRMNRLRKMLVGRTYLNGPVCGTQYCPFEKTPYVLITIFLLIPHHYLKSTKTYLNKGNRGTREQGTGEEGEEGKQGKQEEQWPKGDKGNMGIGEQQLIFIFSF